MTEPCILVPLDGSRQALSALPVARVISEIGHHKICILNVSENGRPEADIRDRLAQGTRVLDGLHLELRTGVPADEILRAARELECHLVVMCRHSRPERVGSLGRTATAVLRDAPCPVVLVPPERGLASWRLQHALVPHDGTPTTSAALPPAAQIAEQANAELLVAYVAGPGAAPEEPGSFTTPRYMDQPQHEWPSWQSEFVNRLAGLCPLGHLHMRVLLAHGDPAAEILCLSERQAMDLIVLAWKGNWEAPRAAILKKVLPKANCPVMVVRTTGAQPKECPEPPLP